MKYDSPYKTPKAKLINDELTSTKSYAKYSFHGRIVRVRYISYTFVDFIFAVSIIFIVQKNVPIIGIILALFYLVKLPIGFVCASVQRAHDLGYKARWGFIILIPFAFLYFYLKPGDKGTNDFGDAPLNIFYWDVVRIMIALVLSIPIVLAIVFLYGYKDLALF